MYIITDKNNVVIGVTENVIYAQNGDVGINDTYFLSKTIVGEILEVDTLPLDYEDNKYKYVNGEFTVREDWKQYQPPITTEELQEQLEMQEQAITELSIYIATLGI